MDHRWFSVTDMPAESRGRWTRLVVLIVVVAYLVSGLIGHDPWKQDETYVASIIHHIYESEDWVVPVSAGQSFMENPPLYFVVAEETADLLERWLPIHDGARLSNLLWMAAVVGCVAAAARLAWPARREADLAAALALLSSLGLVLHAHSLVVDVALLAGFAAGLLGLCLLLQQPALGGALFGTGVGIAFLAKGLLGPGSLGLPALVLTLLFEPW